MGGRLVRAGVEGGSNEAPLLLRWIIEHYRADVVRHRAVGRSSRCCVARHCDGLARRWRERMLTGVVKYDLSTGLVVWSDEYMNLWHVNLLLR